jgi:hypothetical protein
MFWPRRLPRALIVLAFLVATQLGGPVTGGGVALAEECLKPPAGLTNWWSANETTDDLVGTEPASLVGDTTYGEGKAGDAFDFDGNGDWVNLGAEAGNFGTDDFSLDLWFNQRGPVAGEQILYEKYVETLDTAPRTGWGVVVMPGPVIRVFGPLGGNAAIIDQPVELVTDTWYHLAITRDGGTFKLYLDGELMTTVTLEVLDVTSPADGKLGYRGGPEDTPGSVDDRGFYLNGLIDEVHFFDQALSADEVEAIHDAGSAGLCKRVAR